MVSDSKLKKITSFLHFEKYALIHPLADNVLKFVLQELYTQNYYSIDWPAQRNNVCRADLYAPHTRLFDFVNVVLGGYESCAFPPLRRAACARAYELVVLEDENTAYQTLAPVSKMMNLVCRAHVEGPESEAYKQHEIKRHDFMWLGKDGMMMCGTNGSQLWDAAFITQALVETGLANEEENKPSLIKALEWLDQGQILDNPKHYETSYRHTTKGAWGFSTKEQGYTVGDCTGEGLKSVIYLQEHLEFVTTILLRALYTNVGLQIYPQTGLGATDL
jgi:lanosterol synthase